MSDVLQNTEVSTNPDYVRDYEYAVRVIRMVEATALERTQGGYTLQFLDRNRLPAEHLQKQAPKPQAELTQMNTEEAQKAAVALAVEAAYQILESRPQGQQMREESTSLEAVARMAIQSAGYAMMLEAKHPSFLADASKSALERRNQLPSQPDQLTEQKLVENSKAVLSRAAQFTQQKVQVFQGYFGR